MYETSSSEYETQKPLPTIPVIELTGEDWPIKALKDNIDRCHTILDDAHSFMPRIPLFAIKSADKISRRWLAKTQAPWLAEVDEIASLLDRPGAYALNVAYEWGCTSRVTPSANKNSAELVRILDWPFVGLGRNIMAFKITSSAGQWINLSWPGFTGVLTAVAKGRFAGALNQAPLEKSLNISPYVGIPLDWLSSCRQVWRSNAPAPVHLLRDIFQNCTSYEEAKHKLCHEPLAIPAIFTLSGVTDKEGCVIERKRDAFRCLELPASAANHWQNEGQKEQWQGYPRAFLNPERAEQLSCAALQNHFPPLPMSYKETEELKPFDWMQYPTLNQYTRLAMIADAKTGWLIAQGIEEMQPATKPLILEL